MEPARDAHTCIATMQGDLMMQYISMYLTQTGDAKTAVDHGATRITNVYVIAVRDLMTKHKS